MKIRIVPEVKDKFNKPASIDGETTRQMVERLKRLYKKGDIGVYIDDLWKRIGGKLKFGGVKSKDIGRAIKEIRKKDENGCLP